MFLYLTRYSETGCLLTPYMRTLKAAFLRIKNPFS